MPVPRSIIPARRRRRRRRRALPPPGPAPLTLVLASFDAPTMILRLGFDRAIDVSGLVAGSFVVNDGGTGIQYGGQGSGVVVDPTTVDVEMTEIQSMGFTDVRLTTTGPTGIVAAGDGGTWAGVVDLLLPLP